jgi:DNA-binding response OmpR family regulator
VAVDVAATAEPDLVVLDAKLPSLDGLEVMRRLPPPTGYAQR